MKTRFVPQMSGSGIAPLAVVCTALTLVSLPSNF